MSPPTKKELNKGFHGFADDSAEFLKIDRDPFEASSSGEDKRWDDDRGFARGTGAYTGSDSGLRNRLPDERRSDVSDKLAGLVDSDILPGPVSKGGPARFKAKLAPRTNAKDRG
jgi:hypothetical protein